MKPTMSARGERRELGRRQSKAGRMLSMGLAQSEVARGVEVSREAVRRRADKLANGGLAALKNARTLGRPSGLSEVQRSARRDGRLSATSWRSVGGNTYAGRRYRPALNKSLRAKVEPSSS